MTTHRTIGLAACVVAALAACATEDASSSSGGPDASTSLPETDAAADGGEGGSLDDASLDPCLPTTLCPVSSVFGGAGLDLRARLNLVRGRAPDDVWASGAHGAAVHFDGMSWQRSDLGSIETVATIWQRDTGEVAFATLASLYTRGLDVPDGGAPSSDGGWTHTTPSATPDFSASTGYVTSSWTTPSASWLWLTTQEVPPDPSFGVQGVNGLWRARYAPATKTVAMNNPLPDGTCDVEGCGQLTSIHGATADDLWAVGFRGVAVHITAAQSASPVAEAFNSQTIAGLNGVWAASATDVWMVGGAGVVRHYSGTSHVLDVVDGVPTSATLRGVWGTSSTDLWAVGDAKTVLHYDGHTWTSMAVTGLAGRTPDLYSVWTGAPGKVWIAGDGVLLSIGGEP